MTSSTSTASRQIRGSALLLTGSLLAAAVDFLTQIVLVRYLSKADFGAWTYALALVALFASVAQLEMRQVVARFVPTYLERRERGTLLGTIVFSLLAVLGLGLLLAGALVVAITWLGLQPTSSPEALRTLVLLSLLIPIQAVDVLFTSLFAAFGASRAIFLRQSVLGPALRFVVVLGLVGIGADLTFLAIAYTATAAVGIVAYAITLPRIVAAHTDIRSAASEWSMPIREMLLFALPLLASTVVWLLMESSDAVLLGWFFGPEQVANFRVVLPMARMNQIVAAVFGTLYMPLAAKLLARGDQADLTDLYWRTALWMTILTFPVLLLTSSFAPAVVPAVYGEQYASSIPILALLSVAYFFHTATGFNGMTMRVHGFVRFMVVVDLTMAAVNVVINLVLIPRFGPLGAAVGTSVTLVMHNVVKQLGLHHYTAVHGFRRAHARLLLALAGLAGGSAVIGLAVGQTLVVAFVVSALASLAALYLSRNELDVAGYFPEVERIPFLRSFVSPAAEPVGRRRGGQS